jgi:hypothetical protein
MEKTQATERIAQLLDARDVPGTEEQLELLSVRLQELCNLNGKGWVRRHRRRLLRQWTAAIESKP